MYKLFSPKDYTFLGLVFGLPTALYASVRNGLALKDSHPDILRQTMPLVWAFVVLFLLCIFVDGLTVFGAVEQFKTALRWGTSYEPVIDRMKDNFSRVSLVFILVQLVLLMVFVRKTKKIELPIYDSLKQSQQFAPRSNVELVAVGIGVWLAFWLYEQLVAKVMVMVVR